MVRIVHYLIDIVLSACGHEGNQRRARMIEELLGKYARMRYEHPYTRTVLYRRRRSAFFAVVGIVGSVITVMAALPASGVGDNNRFAFFVVSGLLLLAVCWAEWRAGIPSTIDPELI